MSKTLLRACALIALTTAIGCSDDPEPAKNNTTNNPTPDMPTTPDMTVTPTDMGMDQADSPDMPIVEENQAPTCASTPKPERCNADPATFAAWQPASVISKLVIANADCCFDYDGDGLPNNGIAELLPIIPNGGGAMVNATIAASIADGSIALVLEHDGLNSTAAGTEFAMNFLLAEPADAANPAPNAAGGNKYLINPASFDAGTWPQARAEGSKIEAGGKVTAGPGRIVLRLSLAGIVLNLTVSKVRIEGEIDLANSDLMDKGVAIKDGAKLGGIIRIQDLVGELNSFVANDCGCLAYTGPMPKEPFISFDPADPSVLMASENYAKGTCSEADQIQDICITISENASLLSVVGGLTDVRADGRFCDSGALSCDAISIGATIAAYGAVIEGVAPAN